MVRIMYRRMQPLHTATLLSGAACSVYEDEHVPAVPNEYTTHACTVHGQINYVSVDGDRQ